MPQHLHALRPSKPISTMRVQPNKVLYLVRLLGVAPIKSATRLLAHVKVMALTFRVLFLVVKSPPQPLRLPLDHGASGPFSILVVGLVPDSFVVVVVVVAVASSAHVSSRESARSLLLSSGRYVVLP